MYCRLDWSVHSSLRLYSCAGLLTLHIVGWATTCCTVGWIGQVPLACTVDWNVDLV